MNDGQGTKVGAGGEQFVLRENGGTGDVCTSRALLRASCSSDVSAAFFVWTLVGGWFNGWRK